MQESSKLTIQVQDWWEVFLTLSGKAKIIILYVEELSPMLSREMHYIVSSGYKYILCAAAEEIQKLTAAEGLGPGFVVGAVATLSPGSEPVKEILKVLPP